MTRPASWTSAWHTALDDLELDIAAVEQLLSSVHAAVDSVPDPAVRPWTQLPAALGPMPVDLAARARAILQRQQELAGDLTRAMVENRQQRKVAAVMNQRPAAVSVYVDTAV